MTDEPAKPAEASLYDDPATADLAAKVAEAWAEFSRALAESLPAVTGGHREPVEEAPPAVVATESRRHDLALLYGYLRQSRIASQEAGDGFLGVLVLPEPSAAQRRPQGGVVDGDDSVVAA